MGSRFSSSEDPASTMAAQICRQIQSVFTSSSPLQTLTAEISSVANAKIPSRIFLHGAGREGLMLRAFCMRLYHLGLSCHLIGDITTPPISVGDLLISSAGPGSLSTVDAIVRVAKGSGARVVLLTARPDDVKVNADAVVYLDAQTMADEGGESKEGEVRLPMGSVYEGAMFVLFEMVVVRLMDVLEVSEKEMRARHTNLE